MGKNAVHLMSRLRPPKLPPHLEEKFWKSLPPGTRVTPMHELQLNNLEEEPERIAAITDWLPPGQQEIISEARKRITEDEERREYPEPRWDLMLDYWRGGDEEC